MSPPADSTSPTSSLLDTAVKTLAVVLLGGPFLLVWVIPMLAYGYIFFFALQVGIAAIAYFCLDRLLRLTPSRTTDQERRRWRAAILGSLAGILVYGFALALLVEHAPLPPLVVGKVLWLGCPPNALPLVKRRFPEKRSRD